MMTLKSPEKGDQKTHVFMIFFKVSKKSSKNYEFSKMFKKPTKMMTLKSPEKGDQKAHVFMIFLKVSKKSSKNY
jgi:hypothetical protein